MKKALKKKEEKLGEKYELLSEKLTFSNVMQSFFKNAYESFVTTSNVAKLAFSLFQRLAKKKKRSVKKSDRKSPAELEEGKY
jgi:hypothetical protein